MSTFLRVWPGSPGADHAVDRLWSSGAIAVGEGHDERGPFLDAGFADDDDLHAACAALDGHEVEVRVDDGSWWDGWRAFARPVVCGRVVVNPSWLPAPAVGPGSIVPSQSIIVDIDPGRSFGSGAHVTTQLALELLQGVDVRGASVLDVGAGSGVLGIVAARLGARSVTAVDIDPEAVEATARNAVANGVADVVTVRTGGPDSLGGRFEVVLANVPTPAVIDLAPAIVDRSVTGAALVITGFLAERAAAVESAFAGLVVRRRLERAGWVGLHLAVK